MTPTPDIATRPSFFNITLFSLYALKKHPLKHMLFDLKHHISFLKCFSEIYLTDSVIYLRGKIYSCLCREIIERFPGQQHSASSGPESD